MNNSFPLITDTKVLEINIEDTLEPMLDIKTLGTIAIGPSPEIPNNTDYTKMRKTVYDMLLRAQQLLPKGLKFCLYEAYRSLELQKLLFDTRLKNVADLYPNYDANQLFQETIKMVSPVTLIDGSSNIPPHSTGAAIDVYLLDQDNQPIDMGIHPKDWLQDTAGVLSQTNSSVISKIAQQNRHLMNEALSKVGFINYPTEYWHWSYGDRYWAHATAAKHALYGSIQKGNPIF